MKRESVLGTILILVILLASGCGKPPSGDGTIFGRVTEAGTERPLQGAEVIVYSAEGVKLTTTTDTSGNYFISDIPAGSYKVRVDLQGYHFNETEEEIYIEKGKKKVDFQLVVMGGGT